MLSNLGMLKNAFVVLSSILYIFDFLKVCMYPYRIYLVTSGLITIISYIKDCQSSASSTESTPSQKLAAHFSRTRAFFRSRTCTKCRTGSDLWDSQPQNR